MSKATRQRSADRPAPARAASLPSVFDRCQPRPEVLAGELPDAIFAADLWDVITENPSTHADYREPQRFFARTHPTANMQLLVRDVVERLAGVEGGTPAFVLETGFGGGKTHSLIATVHASRHGEPLAGMLDRFAIRRFPQPGEVRVAAFVGEASDPLSGRSFNFNGQQFRTYTPWGQIALMAGGPAGYERLRANDEEGVAPNRDTFRAALGQWPVLILIDELVLYMARAFALREDHPRRHLNSQFPTFLQTLFGLAAIRPQTAVVLTLPTEQDANRRLTADLRQHVSATLSTIDELQHTVARQGRNLTPTQPSERAAVLTKRLIDRVSDADAPAIAEAFGQYYEQQRQAGVPLDSQALEPGYLERMRNSYPFHPEFVRLFSERLADIPEFQATRGALRLVARVVRAVWDQRERLPNTLLLQPQHIDLTRPEIRDEILTRLERRAFERGLDADVVQAGGTTHAAQVEAGWPWPAATEAAVVTFLHSLPDGSRGLTPPEVALAVGRPGCDLAYVSRALEETERRAWYMRREGDNYLFRTRASINKRFQERAAQIQPGEIRQTLDGWVEQVYSGFGAFGIIAFPTDHSAITDTAADRIRLVIVHYNRECGAVGGGDRLSFTRGLYTQTGASASQRTYRNNLVFLLAEQTRVDGLLDAVRSLLAWERVRTDIETEQANVAQAHSVELSTLRSRSLRGDAGVPPESSALTSDLEEVRSRLGTQELNVRTRLLEAYRVLAFPRSGATAESDLFSAHAGPLLECFRVEFGVTPDGSAGRRPNPRQAIAEGPILQCLRDNGKLVPEPGPDRAACLAPEVVRRPPAWPEEVRRLCTEEVWDRFRREPELPMLLRPTDLLPTFRAGLTAQPEPLWVYYDQAEKRLYTRDSAASLSPVISPQHFLIDARAAVADRILPVTALSAEDVSAHLWPRQATEQAPSATTVRLVEAARASPHFPVLPERGVLWRALEAGTRERRWVLHLRGQHLAIGAAEMNEWPTTPRFDDTTELWLYQAALDQGFYPRKGAVSPDLLALTPANLRERCWPRDQAELATESLERNARAVWADLGRSRLEELLRQGLREGAWSVWRKGADETFFTLADSPLPAVQVAPGWSLVEPASALAGELEVLRPGRGPQPVTRAGTPREAILGVCEEVGRFANVRVAELTLVVNGRDALDNTLQATWADRPRSAGVRASLSVGGQRSSDGQTEEVQLDFAGRFETVRAMLAPVWPFAQQGEIVLTVEVRLTFTPPVPLEEPGLKAYCAAVAGANQGTLEARLVPIRARANAGD